jgi:hypothetical protein
MHCKERRRKVHNEHSDMGVGVATGDVLNFVALAISVGLTVALVLGASVLLLASAAHAAPARDEAAGCREPKCKAILYTCGPATRPSREHA